MNLGNEDSKEEIRVVTPLTMATIIAQNSTDFTVETVLTI